MTKREQDRLNASFEAACNMYFASDKDNFSRCGSFHIKPFNIHWDKKTVKEVMHHVKLYLGSWVISPMEEALNKKRSTVKNTEQKRHTAANKRRKQWRNNGGEQLPNNPDSLTTNPRSND